MQRPLEGIVVLDFSASISAQSYLRVEKAIQGLTNNDQKVGLVVFSDTAYEMLPPGSPSRELRRLLRLFRPIGGSGGEDDADGQPQHRLTEHRIHPEVRQHVGGKTGECHRARAIGERTG